MWQLEMGHDGWVRWPLGDTCFVTINHCAHVGTIAVPGQRINSMLDKKQPKGKVSLQCATIFSLLCFIPTGSSKSFFIHHMPLACLLWVHCHDEKLLHELSRRTQDWLWAVYIAFGENVTQMWGNNPWGISSICFKMEILTVINIFFKCVC